MYLLKEIMPIIRNGKLPYYIYCLHKPDGSIFYIGKGTRRDESDQRLSWHEYLAKLDELPKSRPYINLLNINTIRKIWKNGGQIFYTIDSWHENSESYSSREIELIKKIGRKIKSEGTLTNISEGGEKNCVSEETKLKISESLKKYYQDHPEILNEISKKAKSYYINNPEARENRKNISIESNTSEKLVQWIKNNPDLIEEKAKRHSEFMTEWHQTDEGKAVTKQNAIKRNEKVRTDEHRQHMANKTKEYIENNKESFLKVRQKIAEDRSPVVAARNEALELLADYLYLTKKIRSRPRIPSDKLYKWKKRGLLDNLNLPDGHTFDINIWKDYKSKMLELIANVPA